MIYPYFDNSLKEGNSSWKVKLMGTRSKKFGRQSKLMWERKVIANYSLPSRP